jgi:ABC-2 type transport system ATP-binding protein
MATDADPLARAHGLGKTFRDTRAVDGVDFTVARGEVLGFLGPNGSGKTTTIRMMLGLIRPTTGTLDVLGANPWTSPASWRSALGYVPGDLNLYERMTGRATVRFAARVRGMDGTGDADSLARRLELDLDRSVKVLSRGNRQKLGLVLALMHRPDLLVLDEPTSGLDPLMQQVFQEIVREVVADGRSVFLSSHVLGEVQRVADRVAVIRSGRLMLTQSVDELRRTAFARMEATFACPPPHGAFDGVPGARVIDRFGKHVVFALEGSADPLVKALATHEVLAIDSHEADLEAIFLTLYAEAPDAA